jgi:ribose transport system substrate-binding protein
MMNRPIFLFTLAAAAAVIFTGCEKKAAGPSDSAAVPRTGKKLAFIINNPSPFWDFSQAGLNKAAAELGVNPDFQSPNTGTVEEQNRLLETILSKKDSYGGVAISPLDPKNQTEILNKVAAELPLITHDSDAPNSQRRFFVGTNNVEAGKALAMLMKEKMPEGGSFALFVGSLDALNAKQRRQGIIQELSDGAVQDAPNDKPVALGKYTLVESMTDNTDRAAAQQNVEAAVRRYTDLKAVCGLWSYNPPQCLEALKTAGKLGQVKVFAFDEEKATLAAIAEGVCEGTIVQQPFEFGYQSMKYLNKIDKGEALEVPANKEFPIPVLTVKKENLDEFKKNMEAQLSGLAK